MSKSAEIAFLVILALEAAAIITGNLFTIFVFFAQRTHLKRTCFLLINLAVADLLVGLTEPIILGTRKVPGLKAGNKTGPMEDQQRMKNPSSALQVFASSTSVVFLALISLERAHAVLRPIRHRVINTRVFICAIIITWMAGLCFGGIDLLAMYQAKMVGSYTVLVIHSCLFLSVLIICGSYLTIRTRLRPAPPELEVHKRNSMEQNVKLTRTFFIVAATSLVFWLPAIIVYTIMGSCHKECGFSPLVVEIVKFLHLANSMVNPLVYCFRMPIFKTALKKCCGRSARNIESRGIHFNVEDETVEFTTHL